MGSLFIFSCSHFQTDLEEQPNNFYFILLNNMNARCLQKSELGFVRTLRTSLVLWN
jgi:hypothetical protein